MCDEDPVSLVAVLVLQASVKLLVFIIGGLGAAVNGQGVGSGQVDHVHQPLEQVAEFVIIRIVDQQKMEPVVLLNKGIACIGGIQGFFLPGQRALHVL